MATDISMGAETATTTRAMRVAAGVKTDSAPRATGAPAPPKDVASSGWLEPVGIALAFFGFGIAWAASLPATAEGPYSSPSMDERSATGDVAGLPEARVWLVDGYNVLHSGLLHREDRAHFWSRPHRDRLRARVECFEGRADEVWIVFDGGDPGGEGEGRTAGGARVRTVFAPSADDWLVKTVREARRPDQLAVVTADRQVAGRAQHRGALVVSPRRFLAECPGP